MKEIKLETWERKKLFNFFNSFDCPRYSISLKLDASKAYRFCNDNNYSFFAFCLYVFLRANNEVPAFRLRFFDDKVIDLETVGASTAILHPKTDIFTSIRLDYTPSMSDFFNHLQEEIQKSKTVKKVPPHDDGLKEKPLVSLTCIPWFSFDGASLPCLDKKQGMPLFTWGKLISQGRKKMLPLSMQINHMFIDGVHIGQLVELVQSYFNKPEQFK